MFKRFLAPALAGILGHAHVAALLRPMHQFGPGRRTLSTIHRRIGRNKYETDARNESLAPTRQETLSNLRRAAKRADRWRQSKRTRGAPPRHILEKMQMTNGMEVS